MLHREGTQARGCCALWWGPIALLPSPAEGRARVPPRHGSGLVLPLAPRSHQPSCRHIRCDVATLVPPLPSTRFSPVEIRRVLPACSPRPRGDWAGLSRRCRDAHPGVCKAEGRRAAGRGENPAVSRREEGCRRRCEPIANWAVVSVVWRLLLTTRYN